MPENSPAFALRSSKTTLLTMTAMVIAVVNASYIYAQARAATADPEDQAASGIGSAVARIETPVRDFGRITPSASLQTDFSIGNGGTIPLEILRIEPTYGCAIVGDPPKFIPPGESRTLTLKLDPATLRGFFDKQIVVTTSDPTNSTLILRMRGEMRRIIEVSPPAAGFGKSEPHELRERVLTISNGSSEPFTVATGAPIASSALCISIDRDGARP
ncbi:MAG: DUF1573 domain-containing protein [Planctomycetes bacterium]|nr:DUF1573 domain-containing protein [Planctomycetota bacterium]